jgi:hypothetical protein
MLEQGSVKAGDELVHEYSGIREIAKVDRITTENSLIMDPNGTLYRAGVIILESGARFTPDGRTIGFSAYVEELHALTPELRKEIEAHQQYNKTKKTEK